VLSNALKIPDKVTVALEAVENKIRQNSQGWEDAWIIGERQVITVATYKGQIYLFAEHRPAKFKQIDKTGLREAGYGPEDFGCVAPYAGRETAFRQVVMAF
jgi:hypothetical protein